jgi:hypothetical protein
MQRSSADRDRFRRTLSVGSLPEDGHHNPQETPEAWLLAQEHAEAAKKQRQGPGSKSRAMTVPYLGLEVTPELVAISMGEYPPGQQLAAKCPRHTAQLASAEPEMHP